MMASVVITLLYLAIELFFCPPRHLPPAQVESVLFEESNRVQSYLLPSSEHFILKTIVDVLLTRQQAQVRQLTKF